MNAITLSQPSTLQYGWFEDDNRQVHRLWVVVDGCRLELDQEIAWVADEALEAAIELGELPLGAEPNWFPVMIDEDDTETQMLMSHMLEHEADTPLEKFLFSEVQRKTELLREMGAPSSTPLQKIGIDLGDRDTPRWYRAEACHEGVLINPVLPESLEYGLHGELSEVERQLWHYRPYIQTRRPVGLESYKHYADRTRAVGVEPMNEAEWNDHQSSILAKWHERFPSGVAFDVRCIDGRTGENLPTWWGDADSLEAALAIVRRQCPTWVWEKRKLRALPNSPTRVWFPQQSSGGSRHEAR